MLSEDEGSISCWLRPARVEMFTSEAPVLFDPVLRDGVRLSMLKSPDRRLHVRVEGLPGRTYQMAGDIPPVDRHGLFVCVRWTPCKVDLFLGQMLAHQIQIPTH